MRFAHLSSSPTGDRIFRYKSPILSNYPLPFFELLWYNHAVSNSKQKALGVFSERSSGVGTLFLRNGSIMGIRTERGYSYAIANRFPLLFSFTAANVRLASQNQAGLARSVGGAGHSGLFASGRRRDCYFGRPRRKSEQLNQPVGL